VLTHSFAMWPVAASLEAAGHLRLRAA